MAYSMQWGIGGAQAAWRLAQSRTHQSSLAVPLATQFAHYDAPSREYLNIARTAQAAYWFSPTRYVFVYL